MIETYKATPDIDVLQSTATIAGFGSIAINAFVLHGSEPLLVDTGAVVDADDFMTALRSVIDPADLAWIWLTHTDFDHIGALHRLLAENPRLRVITTFFGMGIMGLAAPLPIAQVCLVNPGETITLGDRTLTAIKPPLFDNAVTTGFHDQRSRALFTADCFGALLPAVPHDAADLSDDELRRGQIHWATIDSPWLHNVDRARYAQELRRIREIDPSIVLSAHLPPAGGAMTERLLGALEAAPSAQPFTGPDQATLRQLLTQMTAGSAQ